MKSRKGYLIGALVVAIAFGVLLFKAFGMFGSYSLTVSQFQEKQAALGISVTQFTQTASSPGGDEVTVHGWVADSSIMPDARKTGFAITDGLRNVAVAYSGGLASTLPPGAEVVVQGKNNNGVLQASRVTTTKEVRLEGPLSADVPVVYDINTRTTRFAITDTAETGTKSSVPVAYTGAVPDTFFVDVKRVDVSMVAIGREGPNGVFLASQILTKCASKYEPALTTPAAQ